ncbi:MULTISPECIES: hypothetical protein [unclassified Lactobacillus]|nr:MULTISPECIES: hypothetical protein [unclassified Lactobacillus]
MMQCLYATGIAPSPTDSNWHADFQKYYYAKRVFPSTKAINVHQRS